MSLVKGLSVLSRFLGCALVWSEAFHQVAWLWGLLGGAGQCQPLPAPYLDALQGVVQMVATCAGVGGTWKRSSCELGSLPLVLGLGSLIRRYRAHWGQMLLVGGLFVHLVDSPWGEFRRVYSMSQIGHLYVNNTEVAWVGLQVGWDRASGNPQGWVSQGNGDSDMVFTWTSTSAARSVRSWGKVTGDWEIKGRVKVESGGVPSLGCRGGNCLLVK